MTERIILLFDLDCFYAQCERVRLGLDVNVCLALLQWNSVLAVTYPAREFGIERGDSWDDVDKKSKGECWAIHLQVLEKQSAQQQQQQPQAACSTPETREDKEDATIENVDSNVDNCMSVEESYDQVYKRSREEQLHCQQKERGVRRLQHEGKACLEAYRLASQRIFSVVLESLTRRLGKEQFVLERASIDEFYLDISTYCFKNSVTAEPSVGVDMDNNNTDDNTVVVGNAELPSSSAESAALKRACKVAQWTRQDLWDTLGFTMSAGVSINKTMAKLAAGHGKPNGQAVIHPDSFDFLMDRTKLRKVRGFGGKLGKLVQALLPSTEDATMGNVRTSLSVPMLQNALNSSETALFVYYACRGIDREPVKETTGALVKSITAFKSFPPNNNNNSRLELKNWIDLLATEIVARVSNDSVRNKRYPKSCTLNYAYNTTGTTARPDGSRRTNRQSKSLRFVYPHEKVPHKAEDLVQQAMERLDKLNLLQSLRGVGLSASNFDSRGQPPEGVKSIDSFFSNKQQLTQEQQQTTAATMTTAMAKTTSEGGETSGSTENQKPAATSISTPTAFRLTNQTSSSQRSGEKCDLQSSAVEEEETVSSSHHDKDLEVAKKLQASYDRENYILSTARKGPVHKKARRIETFFQKR
jgi:DNA polymerase eta